LTVARESAAVLAARDPRLVEGLTHGAVTSVDPEGIKSAKDKGSSSSAEAALGVWHSSFINTGTLTSTDFLRLIASKTLTMRGMLASAFSWRLALGHFPSSSGVGRFFTSVS